MILTTLIIAMTVSGVLIGRWAFHRWYNHISIYSTVWGVSLFLLELRLINYYVIEDEVWWIIFTAWILFIIGSLTVVAAKRATDDGHETDLDGNDRTSEDHVFVERRVLEVALWILIAVSMAGAIQTWLVLIDMFGSVSNVILRGAFLYSMRVSEGIKGAVPYFKFLCLPATLLAGVYTAKMGRMKIIAIIPIIISIIVDLSSMGRAMMIMTAILFMTGYFLAKPSRNATRTSKRSMVNIKGVLAISLAIILLIAGSELVRSTRHVNENVTGAKRALKQLQGASFITPTVYLYLSSHHVVFNQYLKKEEQERFVGANTFAPFFRLLAKLGFDTDVGAYQKFYRVPVDTNTGTYLRELHSDFGFMGIVIGPYLIGLITSVLWYRYRKYRTYVSLVILSYLQVLVVMSLFYLVTIAGYLLVFLLIGLMVGAVMDARMKAGRFDTVGKHRIA